MSTAFEFHFPLMQKVAQRDDERLKFDGPTEHVIEVGLFTGYRYRKVFFAGVEGGRVEMFFAEGRNFVLGVVN